MVEEITMKQVQIVSDDDTRTLEQRLAALPNIRDEELPEWREWAKYNFPNAR
jgi:hypothetical protein